MNFIAPLNCQQTKRLFSELLYETIQDRQQHMLEKILDFQSDLLTSFTTVPTVVRKNFVRKRREIHLASRVAIQNHFRVIRNQLFWKSLNRDYEDLKANHVKSTSVLSSFVRLFISEKAIVLRMKKL
jgi:hypothetical protein